MTEQQDGNRNALEITPLMMDVKAGYYNNHNKANVVVPLPAPPPKRLASALSDDDNDDKDDDELHKTNQMETFLHLLKGYMGAGCLSLPWAVSQLGIRGGVLAIFAVSYWSSYNCWTVVKLKRFMEKSFWKEEEEEEEEDGAASQVSGSVGAASSTTHTNITYPDVGQWAYGRQFQSYVTACICVQQLAICTVFLSFCGENLLAVMRRLQVNAFLATHVGVMTVALPFVLALSLVPSLKMLAPVMAVGTLLLLLTFCALGIVIVRVWNDRPEELPPVHPSGIPLATCAILYSYEGICLILPVESAMKEPRHFQKLFTWAMVCVACILATVASVCVAAFGNVTSGSVTAFLVQMYRGDPTISWWLMVANTAISLSVLLTYPLQLFPALELMGPWLSTKLSKWYYRQPREDENDDLSAFEPLPPLPEHDVASLDSLPASEHHYATVDDGEENGEHREKDAEDDVDASSYSGVSSVTSFFPTMTMPGDSPQLRATLVVLTYAVAVAVPNVQALISLAGAVAGSSTALLIPPILELAWIRHLEGDWTNFDVESEASFWMLAPATSPWGRFWREKIKCYLLLAVGLVFMGIGTFASISDIVRIYVGK